MRAAIRVLLVALTLMVLWNRAHGIAGARGARPPAGPRVATCGTR